MTGIYHGRRIMRRLLLERALNMKKKTIHLERGFLALAAILLGLVASAQAATGVSYTIGDKSDTVGTIKEAATAVNSYVKTKAAGTYDAEVRLHNSSYSAPGSPTSGVWAFDGAENSADYSEDNYGFKNLSITGISSKSKLSASGNDRVMLLKLLNATGTISAENLVLSGGNYSYDDIRNSTTGDQKLMGTIAGGAGLTAGSNGFYGGDIGVGAATAIKVKNVNAAANSITLTNPNFAKGIYGAGIMVNAYGLKADEDLDNNTGLVNPYDKTVTTFTDVNLTDNQLSFSKGSASAYAATDPVEAFGGGAAIRYGKFFDYVAGTVSGNSASINNGNHAGSAAATGGGLYTGAEKNTLTDLDFKNNFAYVSSANTANEYDALASGGAAFFDYDGTGTQTNQLTGISAEGNSARAEGGGHVLAAGGAFFFTGDESNSIVNSNITGNSASSTYDAFGGGIYLDSGTLTLDNTSLTNNSVSTSTNGRTALGSAIFANTEDNVTVHLFAASGKTVNIDGNRADGLTTKHGIVFGRAAGNLATAESGGAASLALNGDGTFRLMNGLTVDMKNHVNNPADPMDPASTNYGFTFHKGSSGDITSSGPLYLDGEFSFTTPNGTSTMDLDDGLLFLGSNFQASNKNPADGSTRFKVDLTGVDGINFDLSRPAGTALFNFANAATDSMDVDPNTKVTTTGYARSVASYDYVYRLVSGLDSDNINELAQNLVFSTGNNRYISGEIDIDNNNNLVANVNFTSPFQYAGPNARSAQYPLQRLIDSGWGKLNVTDAEIGFWLDSPLSVIPNLYIEQADIMFNGADRIGQTAVYTGLKQAHRAKLYNENYQAGRDRYMRRSSSYSGTYSGSGSTYPRSTDYGYPAGAGISAGMPATGLSSGYSNGFQTGGMGAQAGVQAGGMGLQGGYSAGVQGGGVGVQGGMGMPGGMVGGGVSAGGGDYNYNSSSAFPSARLMDCASLYDGYGFRLWAGYIGDFRSKSTDDGFAGYKTTRHGFLVGLNYDWGALASAGFYAGYSHTRTNTRATDEHSRGDNAHIGLMGRLSPFERNREFSIYGDIGYHYAHNRYNRGVGYNYEAHSSFNQDLFGFGIGVEQIFRVGGVNLIPHAELRYGDMSQGGLSESGSSATLSVVDGPSADACNTRVGVEVGKDFYAWDTAFTPTVGAAWRHDYGDRNYETFGRYSYNPDGGSYRLLSGNTSRDSADISAALKTLTDMGGGTTLGFNVSYNINLAGKTTTQTVYAGVEVGF